MGKKDEYQFDYLDDESGNVCLFCSGSRYMHTIPYAWRGYISDIGDYFWHDGLSFWYAVIGWIAL